MVQSFQEWANSPERVNIFEREDNIFRNEEKLFNVPALRSERAIRIFEDRCRLFEEQFDNIPKLDDDFILENWALFENDSLNKLDESKFKVALDRDDYLNEAFPILNEAMSESTKDSVYAAHEIRLFALHHRDWFNKKPERGMIPVIFETEDHKIICFKNESFAISKKTFDILINGNLNEGVFSFIGKGIGWIADGLGLSDGWEKRGEEIGQNVDNDITDLVNDAGDLISDIGDTVWKGVKAAYNDPLGVIKSGLEFLSSLPEQIGKAAVTIAKFLAACMEGVYNLIMGVDDWVTVVNTISTILRGLLSTVGYLFAPGVNVIASQIISACNTAVLLTVGYERVVSPWGKISDKVKAAKNNKELGLVFTEYGPNLLRGCGNIIMGIAELGKTMSGAMASPLGAAVAISQVMNNAGGPDRPIGQSAEGLFSEKNAVGVGALMRWAGIGNYQPQPIKANESAYIYEEEKKETPKSDSSGDAKDESFPSLLQVGGSITVEYLMGKTDRDLIKRTLPSIGKGIESVLDSPNRAKKMFDSWAEDKESFIILRLVKNVVGAIMSPLMSGIASITNLIKSVTDYITEPLRKLPGLIDDTIKKVMEFLGGQVKGLFKEVTIPVMKTLEKGLGVVPDNYDLNKEEGKILDDFFEKKLKEKGGGEKESDDKDKDSKKDSEKGDNEKDSKKGDGEKESDDKDKDSKKDSEKGDGEKNTKVDNQGYSSEKIKKIQKFLVDKSLMKGTGSNGKSTIDGKFGQKTKEALKEYQKSAGLKQDGKIDDTLIAKIEDKKTRFDNQGYSEDTIKEIQKILVDKGFMKETRSNGKPSMDGKFGEESRKALKEYQKSVGLKQNGAIGDNLLSKMDISAEKKKKKKNLSESKCVNYETWLRYNF